MYDHTETAILALLTEVDALRLDRMHPVSVMAQNLRADMGLADPTSVLPRPTVVITISGGVLQDIGSDQPSRVADFLADIIVVDYDCDGAEAHECLLIDDSVAAGGSRGISRQDDVLAIAEEMAAEAAGKAAGWHAHWASKNFTSAGFVFKHDDGRTYADNGTLTGWADLCRHFNIAFTPAQ